MLLPLLVVAVAVELLARVKHQLPEIWETLELCTRPSADRARVYEYISSARCKTNARGFHDVDRAVPKPPGTYRIVVVGDSVADGLGIEQAKKFSPQLEARLTARVGRPVEVAIVAVPGYSTEQELALAPEIRRLEPDLVLWIYCLNDPAHPFYDDASASLNQYHDRPRSYALRWLGGKLHNLRRTYFSWRGWCDLHDDDRNQLYIGLWHCWDWPSVAKDIRKVRDVGGPGVPVIFAVYPYPPDTQSWAGYFAEPLTGKLLAEARKDGMETLDLKDAFLATGPASAIFRLDPPEEPDRWHMGVEGHALMATYLEERLVERVRPAGAH